MESQPLSTTGDGIGSLAYAVDQLNASHELLVMYATDAVELAVEMGDILSKVKATVGHGNFLPWIEENLRFSRSTAARYMRAARTVRERGLDRSRLPSLASILSESEDDRPEVPPAQVDGRSPLTEEERRQLEEYEARIEANLPKLRQYGANLREYRSAAPDRYERFIAGLSEEDKMAADFALGLDPDS